MRLCHSHIDNIVEIFLQSADVLLLNSNRINILFFHDKNTNDLEVYIFTNWTTKFTYNQFTEDIKLYPKLNTQYFILFVFRLLTGFLTVKMFIFFNMSVL